MPETNTEKAATDDLVELRKEGNNCPCFIRIQRIKVSGDSTSAILSFLAKFLVCNPYNRDYYHSALEIQIPEDDECPVYVVELQDYVETHSEQKRVGQIKEGRTVSTIVSAFSGPAYGIRKWRNGKIQDIDKQELLDPNPPIVSTDCNKARALLNTVSQVPSNDFGPDWTCNSVISWLLQKNELNPQSVSPPPHGIVPGWREGIVAAGG